MRLQYFCTVGAPVAEETACDPLLSH